MRPFHVAAWIEDFPGSKPTVKQKLAALRMLYDFLVVRQITPSNPAHSVRGPKHVVKKGKTPVWMGRRPVCAASTKRASSNENRGRMKRFFCKVADGKACCPSALMINAG